MGRPWASSSSAGRHCEYHWLNSSHVSESGPAQRERPVDVLGEDAFRVPRASRGARPAGAAALPPDGLSLSGPGNARGGGLLLLGLLGLLLLGLLRVLNGAYAAGPHGRHPRRRATTLCFCAGSCQEQGHELLLEHHDERLLDDGDPIRLRIRDGLPRNKGGRTKIESRWTRETELASLNMSTSSPPRPQRGFTQPRSWCLIPGFDCQGRRVFVTRQGREDAPFGVVVSHASLQMPFAVGEARHAVPEIWLRPRAEQCLQPAVALSPPV
jgi:hypothetical protein